ncbi:hypothetical protein FJR38_25560 [Anabaena sp. UHCC 0253]|uniref:hypothetical protein n=1 Tax=Anabaena sp. UHCC 0253 TaxID=2590019 RepID=UPI001448201C|nr:hypothetical protein [Anabaena sp. UHCC 0253]MTJ55792.1 hypothetical protein [Anabaena sp. UHCC 0253]
MTYLLCLSPIILDQSFPRSENELKIVACAIGELQEFISNDKVHLISTDILRQFIEDFDWTATNGTLLSEIYNFLSNLFLRQDASLIDIDKYIKWCDECGINQYQAHPVPQTCKDQGLISCWSDELGKILYLHDKCCSNEEFFIGVACAYGFAGECVDKYDNPNNDRAFPIVDQNNIDVLVDAYDWSVPQDIHQKSVSIQNVKKHCKVIGGTLEKPVRDSHYKVKFTGHRSWTFSNNDDPVPEQYLKELVEITSYPLKVIKTALIDGYLPQKYLKLEKVI